MLVWNIAVGSVCDDSSQIRMTLEFAQVWQAMVLFLILFARVNMHLTCISEKAILTLKPPGAGIFTSTAKPSLKIRQCVWHIYMVWYWGSFCIFWTSATYLSRMKSTGFASDDSTFTCCKHCNVPLQPLCFPALVSL